MFERADIDNIYLTLINDREVHRTYYSLIANGKLKTYASIRLRSYLDYKVYYKLTEEERNELRQRVFEYYLEEAGLKKSEDTQLKKTPFEILRDDEQVRTDILEAIDRYSPHGLLDGTALRHISKCISIHNHAVRLGIDVHEIVQTKKELVEYFMSRVVNNETPTKPEEEVKMKEYTVVTKTFIGNVEASEVTDDQIFAAIREIETTIAGMDGIDNKPKKLQAKIASLKEVIKGLVDYVDAR